MSNSAICVDASFVARLFLGPDEQPYWALLETWTGQGTTMYAPSLLAYEVSNVFYRYHRAGYLSLVSANLVIDAALGLPIRLQDDLALHRAAARIATMYQAAAVYDAHYLALAERLGAPLWTADAELARQSATTGIAVNLVAAPAG